jgi:hypothetical protein
MSDERLASIDHRCDQLLVQIAGVRIDIARAWPEHRRRWRFVAAHGGSAWSFNDRTSWGPCVHDNVVWHYGMAIDPQEALLDGFPENAGKIGRLH